LHTTQGCVYNIGDAVIGQRLPMNLAVYPLSLFAVGLVKCSQRPIGVNAATDESA